MQQRLLVQQLGSRLAQPQLKAATMGQLDRATSTVTMRGGVITDGIENIDGTCIAGAITTRIAADLAGSNGGSRAYAAL
jgi:hypothetical protein